MQSKQYFFHYLIENSQGFCCSFFFFLKVKLQFVRRSMRGRKEMETFEQLPSQQNPVTPQPLAAAPGISCLSFPNEWHTWPCWLLGCSIPLEPAAYRFLVSWDISAVPSGTMCPLNAWGHLLPKSHLRRMLPSKGFDTLLLRKPQLVTFKPSDFFP